MVRRTAFLGTSLVLFFDGLLAALLGRAYLRVWLRVGGPLARWSAAMLRWPGWVLRLVGLTEAVLGLRLLAATHERVGEVYQSFAGIYDPFLAVWYATLARGVNPAIDRTVREHLPPGGDVLDLGAGTGSNIERLLRLDIPFSRYVGVDMSESMLAQARRKFGYLPTVTLAQRDLLRDPLPEGAFDLVIATWVFSHLGRGAEEVTRKGLAALKDGGSMVVLVYTRPDSWLDPLASGLGALILARPLERDIYASLPGIVTSERLMGGMATLLVLSREQAQREEQQTKAVG